MKHRLWTVHRQTVVVFDSYLQVGQSLSGVAKQLTQLGVKTPAGGKIWHPSSLRQLLTNPTYTGTLYANREHVTPARRRRSPLQPVGQKESSVPTPSSDWIVVCQVPMIVSQERFEQVQAKLRENASLAGRNNTAHPYLLKSLVSCGLCRGACVGVTRGTHSYYLCHANGILSTPIRKNGVARAIFRLVNLMSSCGWICANSSLIPPILPWPSSVLKQETGCLRRCRHARSSTVKRLPPSPRRWNGSPKPIWLAFSPWKNIVAVVRS
jgi:Recombinase